MDTLHPEDVRGMHSTYIYNNNRICSSKQIKECSIHKEIKVEQNVKLLVAIFVILRYIKYIYIYSYLTHFIQHNKWAPPLLPPWPGKNWVTHKIYSKSLNY